MRRIGVIGGGFSGTMFVVQLLRAIRSPVEIFLFDRSGSFGRGLAYSTRNPQHLLNVRVANMSAFEDDPRHFIRWLWEKESEIDGGLKVPPSGHAFVPRALYGSYLESVLQAALEVSSRLARVHTVASDVIALTPEGAGFRLRHADGNVTEVDQAVLCVGNLPRAAPFEPKALLDAAPRFIADSWDESAIRQIAPDDAVAIIGTGLTMVDVAIDLVSRGHRAKLRAFSQRGLLPQVHEQTRPYRGFLDGRRLPDSALAQFRALKREVRQAAAEGFDWRSVMDAVRPVVQELWLALPKLERRRFLRHLRPYWDTHRHRMAPGIAAEIAVLRQAGRLETVAARPIGVDIAAEHIDLRLRRRGGGTEFLWRADWLINCTGPECDFTQIRHPLVRSLLDQGMVRPDVLRLGLDVTDRQQAIAADGGVYADLFALGPPTRGALWEITAVPDIRKQCARLAERLATEVTGATRADSRLAAVPLL
jgi:uncharacterized NAD(P)/FAD-binding protein YdhS